MIILFKSSISFYLLECIHLYFESYFFLASVEMMTLFILTMTFEVGVSDKTPIP